MEIQLLQGIFGNSLVSPREMGKQLQEQLQVVFGKQPFWLQRIEPDGDEFVVLDAAARDYGVVTLRNSRLVKYRVFPREGTPYKQG